MSTATSKAAPSKSAASKAAGAKPAETKAAAAAPDEAASAPVVNEPVNGPDVGNSGPGLGVPAPPESTYRPPSTIVDPAASPLDAPADAHTQGKPEAGHNLSSTDPVYAEAGGRTIAGEDFKRLVGPDGKALKSSALFDDSDPGKTFVVTKTRIYEEFYYPGTYEVAKKLMFAQGKRVPRAQAERIKAAIESAPTPLAEV